VDINVNLVTPTCYLAGSGALARGGGEPGIDLAWLVGRIAALALAGSAR
jgi:hypothetical protein